MKEFKIKIDIWATNHDAVVVLSGNSNDWHIEQLYMFDSAGNEVNIYPLVNNEDFMTDLETEIEVAIAELQHEF